MSSMASMASRSIWSERGCVCSPTTSRATSQWWRRDQMVTGSPVVTSTRRRTAAPMHRDATPRERGYRGLSSPGARKGTTRGRRRRKAASRGRRRRRWPDLGKRTRRTMRGRTARRRWGCGRRSGAGLGNGEAAAETGGSATDGAAEQGIVGAQRFDLGRMRNFSHSPPPQIPRKTTFSRGSWLEPRLKGGFSHPFLICFFSYFLFRFLVSILILESDKKLNMKTVWIWILISKLFSILKNNSSTIKNINILNYKNLNMKSVSIWILISKLFSLL